MANLAFGHLKYQSGQCPLPFSLPIYSWCIGAAPKWQQGGAELGIQEKSLEHCDLTLQGLEAALLS
jgi:hypothetical protein